MLTDEQIKEIRERLIEVRDKMGPYKIDAFEHARSVMDSSSRHAVAILKILEEKKE